MILRIPAWEELPWLEHGFGTRLSEKWTHTDGRTWLRQVHSSNVVPVSFAGDAGEGDALITDCAGLTLEIRTADCVPILLVDPERRAVAAIHAGWRGTAGHISKQAIFLFTRRFGTRPATIQAAIGPAIGACCYEVGPEVSEEFGLTGRQRLDLVRENVDQFRAAGVMPSKIYITGGCTKCDNRFHSFRRDRELAGRMEAGIGIRRS